MRTGMHSIEEDRLILLEEKVNQITREMLDPKNYYSRSSSFLIVVSRKQEEWISRLSMLVNELKELREEDEKIKR